MKLKLFPKNFKNTKYFIIPLLLIFSIALHSQVLFQPINLDFEEGRVGEIPPGWKITKAVLTSGYKAILNNNEKLKGRNSLQLYFDGIDENISQGSVFQSIYAESFTNKEILFNANLRSELYNDTSYAFIFLKQYSEKGDLISTSTSEKNPCKTPIWNSYNITTKIDENAFKINLGLVLIGRGSVWMDEANFDINSKNSFIEKYNKLEKNQENNILDFAKIYSQMRYFYPNNAISPSDWENLLQFNVVNILRNKNLKSTDILNKLKLYLPESKIFHSKNEIERFNSNLITNKTPNKNYFGWMHKGLYNLANGYYQTDFIDIFNPPFKGMAFCFQPLDAFYVRGKKMTLSGFCKTDLKGGYSNAQLVVRIDLKGKTDYKQFTMDDNPIRSKNWTENKLEFEVPEDASKIRVGIVMQGEGVANFDNIELKFKDKDGLDKLLEITNWDFENSSTTGDIPNWTVPKSVILSGYNFSLDKNEKYKGIYSLQIQSSGENYIELPKKSELTTIKLNDSLYFGFPLNTNITISQSDLDSINGLKNKVNEIKYKDYASRLSILISEYAALKEFSLKNIKIDVLDSKFIELTHKAYYDNNLEEFLYTLGEFNALLNDSQSRVWSLSNKISSSLPFLWTFIDNKLKITQSDSLNSSIRTGYEILKINGQSPKIVIDSIGKSISASTESWKIARSLAILRVGEDSSSIKISYRDNNNVVKETEIYRNISSSEINELRPEPIQELDSNVLYLDFTRIGDKDLKRLIKEVKEYPEFNNLIIDCRGLVKASEYSLGLFIEKDQPSLDSYLPIYTKPDKIDVQIKKYSTIIKKPEASSKKNIVFLIDERTIGYSETIIKIAKKLGIGVTMGSPTAGASGETGAIRLPGGFSLSLTISNEIEDNQKNTNKEIVPDIKIRANLRNLNELNDNVINEAIKYFKNRKN